MPPQKRAIISSSAVHWDPHFLDRSPMFEPLRAHAAPLRVLTEWPDRGALQALVSARRITTAGDAPLKLVAPNRESYEAQVYLRGELQVRSRNWHDLLNVLAWLAYPNAKRELNRRHYLAAREEADGRGRMRDALTLFDESGAVVVSSDVSLLAAIREFQWKPLFWQRREAVREAMRFRIFGHGLFEKALDPYIGLTAHALLIPVPAECASATSSDLTSQLDRLVAGELADDNALTDPRALAPLPVLGVPGWWQNDSAVFYDDTAYFRPGRSQPPGGSRRNE